MSASAERRGFMLATGNPDFVRRDVQHLANLGARIVRLPLYIGADSNMDHWYANIDAALGVARNSDMTVVIDFHWPSPGVQGSQIVNVNDFVARWEGVARRYANEPGKNSIWYDLCNEPKAQNWRNFAMRAARKIRTIDRVHPIVFAATGATVHDVVPLEGIDNQILEFHFYNWSRMQLDFENPLITYPDRQRGYTKDKMMDILQFIADTGKKYRMPVYLGETAIFRDNPTAARFFRDVTQGCDKLNIHLTLHAFREANVWDYENTRTWTVIEDWLRNRP
ncbi:MAG: cellulase family glycosylhydrolase [Chthonomonadaceae bacterium]|nr:cellulase family glycosylhydrolase [Chthonomonadaceae bacterium]